MEIRDFIIEQLRGEIIGPAINPRYVDENTNEEILLRFPHGSPQSKYGAGLLFPSQVNAEREFVGEQNIDDENQDASEDETQTQKTRTNINDDETSIDEEPIALANQYKPSAMGFTARFSKTGNSEVVLKISSAYYQLIDNNDLKIVVKKRDREDNVVNMVNRNGDDIESIYWVRRPLEINDIRLDLNQEFQNNINKYQEIIYSHEGNDWLKLEIYDRSPIGDDYRTCTFSLINVFPNQRNESNNGNDGVLFQNKIELSTQSENLIQPYKEKNSLNDTDDEKEMNLLYRKKRVYGIGHGTSVSWEKDNDSQYIERLFTTFLPTYDMPQIASPENKVYLSMLEHSDLGDWTKVKSSLDDMLTQYKSWIKSLEEQIQNSELINYQIAAKNNITKCKNTLFRIERGVEILKSSNEESAIVKCYKWMNRAMIWQQQRSRASQRLWKKEIIKRKETYNDLSVLPNGENHFESLENFHKGKYNGKWRPFQLAFILMNLEGLINPTSSDRKVIDLIWFPTGGGKTEAYLGLTAITILYRRSQGAEQLKDNYYSGTVALMRYTLRLLTAQQFERASSLICSLELIRRDIAANFELGDEHISIGLWVGGSSSPNKNRDALRSLSKLSQDSNAEYPFIVLKCPCCAAQIGKIKSKRIVKGLKRENSAVHFSCENIYCEFHNQSLPLYVVDEQMYEVAPTLVIGTVDKFAMLTWKEAAGSFFGHRNETGKVKPPELIIQDELHLISGPLGSMVGLYESMIHSLCVTGMKYPPKIVAATATISRAFEQVEALYAIKSNDQLHIFPSQGLEFGDTWFSEEIELSDNSPGRKYVGVMTTGYPSAQTTVVRCYSQILQSMKVANESDKKKDYYWTLLAYFNSIRELGIATSLVFGDIRERLRQIQSRDLIKKADRRILYDNKIQELTSRIKSEKIPENLKLLEKEYSKDRNRALDICLATNMVATGVDISRLGLMFIHGQPKTTAEYVQASSRVGRQVPAGPGLVLTLFNVAKPRDKSLYEQFQGFHCRIYGNVEASSVTPFSINCREKGLHAVLIGLVRHLSKGSLRINANWDVNEFLSITETAKQLILNRVKIVDNSETQETEVMLNSIIEKWKSSGAESYGDAGNFGILNNEQFYPLLYAKSAEVRPEAARKGFGTPTSMRGVDTESNIINYNTLNHE